MATHFFPKTFLLGVVISLFIAGCSSDDNNGGGTTPVTYGGITTDASLNATNAEEIMLKGTESTSQSVNTQDANAANPFAAVASADVAPSALLKRLYDLAKKASSQNNVPDLPINAIINSGDLGPEFCGGSISVPDNFGADGTLNGTVTYNNICYDDGGPDGQIVINGTMTFAETSTNITLTFNFTVTANGVTETFNSAMTCSIDFSTCSFSSDYVGADGKTYRVSDVSISGTDSSGYTVSATFYHPDYGKLTVTTQSALMFNCSNDNPSAGALLFSSADGGTGSITFESCTTYSYSYTVAGGSPVTGSGTW